MKFLLFAVFLPWTRGDKLTLAYDILTGLLVFIGAFGVYSALRTLRIMRGQLGAMREQLAQMKSSGEQTDQLIAQATAQARETGRAVSAAHASTEALINSERAWLIAELEPQAVEGPDNRLYRKVGKNWVPMSTDEIWAGERTISPMRRVCLASNG